DYALSVIRAEAAVVEARQSLARERAEADLAREEWRTLGGGKAADPLVLRQPQMEEATARLKAAEADLELARLAVERTDLRAPFDGRVRSSEVGAGSYVTAGEALARVYATDVAEVRLPLDDRALRFLDLSLDERQQTGPEVDIRAKFAGKRHHWSGRIIRTEGTIDPQSRRLYAVVEVADPYRADRDEGRPPLAVGMFVTASVSGSVAERAYALPAAAFRRPGEVLVVDDEGILRARSVNILRSERDRIIVSEGLRPGERVVVDHPARVFVGSMVTVASPKTSPSLARADQP
ncbi:MAG: efflux RND transporter periplasmic adaptor subunit, partial [Geminicoccaceae bacterium]